MSPLTTNPLTPSEDAAKHAEEEERKRKRAAKFGLAEPSAETGDGGPVSRTPHLSMLTCRTRKRSRPR